MTTSAYTIQHDFGRQNNPLKTSLAFYDDNLDEYTKPGKTWMGGKSTVCDHNGKISNHRLIPYQLELHNILKDIEFKFYTHDDTPLIRRLYFKTRR